MLALQRAKSTTTTTTVIAT